MSATTLERLTDGLGSVMKTTDASGNVVNSYTYDVYGKKTSSSGGQANEFDFAGQQTDASTGLQYLRARYMDTNTGTFMSRDPLAGSPAFLSNSTAYARGNPSNRSDPSGLCPGGRQYCVGIPGLAGGANAAANDNPGPEATAQEIGCGWCGKAKDKAGDIVGGAADIVVAGVQYAQDSPVWWQMRADLNRWVTDKVLRLFQDVLGFDCVGIGQQMYGCFGVSSLTGSAMTIGNVVLVKSASTSKLQGRLKDHERAHASQWALAGLGGPGGQAAFALSYGASLILQDGCSYWDDWAGFESGGYKQCL